MSGQKIYFHDLHPASVDVFEDVVEGLQQSPRKISPKYFYDEQGSKLFDRITKTKEYYPTRTETALLQKYKTEIVQSLGQSCMLIEPGGGSCTKVRILLDELQPDIFIVLDISKEHLLESAKQLCEEIPWLEIHAVCADFTHELKLPENLPDLNKVVFFPGSSIGNFTPVEAVQCLSGIKDLLGSEGKLLIGVDLKKNKNILEHAYNDADGITAQFNLNLLTRFNYELSADFNLLAWEHVSFYNSEEGCIEMHLKSLCEQVVHIGENKFHFNENEMIHTENSYKYTVEEFQALGFEAGLSPEKVWLDDDRLFSLHLFSVINN